jgi:hypothetical protein
MQGSSLVNKERIDLANTGIDRYQVIRQGPVRQPPIAPVHHGMLHERHTDAADHATDALTSRQQRIDDPANCVGADETANRDGTEIGSTATSAKMAPKECIEEQRCCSATLLETDI